MSPRRERLVIASAAASQDGTGARWRALSAREDDDHQADEVA
jgi:hypothetical protein